MAYDVITGGRTGVDLHPLRTGAPLPRVTSPGTLPGGPAAGPAVAAARPGRRTAVITRTGDDPFGARLREAPRDFGADDRRGAPALGTPAPGGSDAALTAGAVP